MVVQPYVPGLGGEQVRLLSPARVEGTLLQGDVFSRLYSCGSARTREHQQSGAHSWGRSTGTALPPLTCKRASPEGYIGIQLPHPTAEQAWAFGKLLTNLQIRFFFPLLSEQTPQVK